VLKSFAAKRVTGPFAFFIAWVIDVTILLAQLRRERRRSGSRSLVAALTWRLRERISWLTR